MQKRKSISQEYLKSILDYVPSTGEWRWRYREGLRAAVNVREAGTIAGTVGDGYRHIMIDGCQYRSHRLAFIYMLGRDPVGDVDHIDMDRSNCRWANLREATRSQNHANKGRRSDNKSGIKGVAFYPKLGKWRAKIQVKTKCVHIGLFETKEAAADAYAAAAKMHFGEFARPS